MQAIIGDGKRDAEKEKLYEEFRKAVEVLFCFVVEIKAIGYPLTL
jgi:hypothetical protein